MRVLAIEDNRPFLNLLRANLTKRGFTVDGTETLEDGTVLASEGGYDAILLDLALPDGDGKQVVAMLRRARDPCRSSCCRHAAGSATASRCSIWAPMTTS
jgi:two-component system, OmpR family, response regulator QseB